jgi:hypothetical protein
MTFNRNYAVVPQIPTAQGFSPIALNKQAVNAAVLPYSFPCPLASEQVVTNPAVSTVGSPYPLVLAIPSKSIIEGQPFTLLISGALIQPGASPTVGFNLYSGTSLTVGNNTLVKAIAATAVVGGAAPFQIEARLIGDSLSAKITGTVKALIGAVLVAEAAIAAPLANINFQNDPVASFLLSVVPTVANAGNILRLSEFALNFA